MKDLIVIGGPNGAGKTTVARRLLPSAQAALERVARRMREGGHGVPDAVVVRRYVAGLRNMRRLYLPLVNVGLVYDNSDDGGALIAKRTLDGQLVVHEAIRWKRIEDATR